MSREVWGRDECTQAPPRTPAGDSGPVDVVWPGHSPRSGLQVSSYGGTLRYELHSETQRGDVFIPTESRPDVVLQVADARVVAGWAGGHSRARTAGALTCTCLPPQGNQMSIMFLEPAYPAPGHVHRGQLQLVEVSGAGLGPRSLWALAWPRAALPTP